MEITIDLIKQLRNKTGAGMSDCKAALTDSNGDIEKAVEYLRKKGAAMAAKRADKITKEGAIKSKISDDKKSAAIIEINCETDFVSKGDGFQNFAQNIADLVLLAGTDNSDTLLASKTSEGISIQETIDSMMESFGEKIEFRRAKLFKSPDGFISDYIHFGSKLGALISMKGAFSEEAYNLGKKIAMQVVAMNPIAINRVQVSNETIEKEKEIYLTQAINENKPEKIRDKIIQNKVEKYFQENCLLEQEYIQESNKSVKDLITDFNKKSGNTLEVIEMVRFQLGS